jgi:hypothetical protein
MTTGFEGSVGASSFGARYTTFGPNEFRGTSVLSSPRYKELDRRQSYAECTQHDQKGYDFDGRILTLAGPGAMVTSTQALINSQVAPFYVPLRSRRPSAPYRLAKVINNSFTNMVFGSQRFPSLRCDGDPDTSDWVRALIKGSNLSTKMIRARTIGGSVGTVGLSWCFDRKGRPRVEVHNGKYLYVHEWEDRQELIPSWVSEVYLTSRDEWDGIKKKFLRKWYWCRRDWSEDGDVVFLQQEYRPNQEPLWMIDDAATEWHRDGECHFAWIQNLPTEEIDGLPDYDGLYEFFDQLDIMLSVITKGAILNLDPTLVLKVDADLVGRMGVRKGSDQSLIVGPEGDATYLELEGTSLEQGVKLFNEKRRTGLETAQCVVLDPTESLGPDVSSVALRQKFGPMTAKCEIYRDQYGAGMLRILQQMDRVGRAMTGQKVQVLTGEKDPEGKDVTEERELAVNLPKKVVRTPQKDSDGQPVLGDDGKPQEDLERVPHHPGEGGEFEWAWPPYFPPTPADQTASITALNAAAGGAAIMSQQTAVEQAALLYGVDAETEWARVQVDAKKLADQQAEQAKNMFDAGGDAAGGKVGSQDGMPPGASPKPKFGGSAAPFGQPPKQDPDEDDEA